MPIEATDLTEEDRLSPGARSVARSLRSPVLSPSSVAFVAACLDAAALSLSSWFAAFVNADPGFDPAQALVAAMASATAAVLILKRLGFYRLKTLRRTVRGTAVAWSMGALISLAGTGTLWSVPIAAVFVIPARLLGSAIAAAVLDYGLTERRAVLFGGGEPALRVMTALTEAKDSDIRVVGIFDDRDDVRSPIAVAGVPKLGGIEALVSFVRATEVDMLIITIPLSAEERIRSIMKVIEVLPVDVRIADVSADPTFRRHARMSSGQGLIALKSRPIVGGKLLVKRTFDLVGALLAIVLLAPVMAMTAVAILCDSPGPILFRQVRHGYNNRPITIWKFRSMYVADCDPEARTIVTQGDPRVTRVGRFIRKTSIDELPQLFNVLRGDLSLVGPRPHALKAHSSRQEPFEAIVEGYAARHRVRPGITGWAQISGWRGEIDDPEALRRRVEHDLYYIENWSLRMDFYVLLMTPIRIMNTSKAY
ncbi:exopolysaccharide biosynthesis polyprenyl glycosylphosphotransferase [Rubellimicrobium arenae]|uniref:exopolysaccharide biosynthesis polyprenyl glycosylphosphotransferase n=1 Tax=Rubellimicrobium arenae TaxID=2817372 RepID=UPI001B30E830|nr:exopolysaccharide biosynthesis polyprenyl glycosylphosphotransferase [Rubellimicrobium arenae]